MVGFPITSCVHFIQKNGSRLKPFLQQQCLILNHARKNHMFNHLSKNKEHDSKYEYEISKDPKEWEFVERLMPLETVPVPTAKPSYPSGWRPANDESLNAPYFVERSRNHMLSVYLKIRNKGIVKRTIIKRIHGDLWGLHDELKAHIEKEIGKKIASFVHEGNCSITFKGDHVYYAEQWLLSKGF